MERVEARLYVTGTLAGALALDGARAHYLRNVLRLKPGARIAVFNAEAGEHAARIAGFTKSGGTVAVEERLRAPADEPDLWLVFAPIKRARIDWVVEKATELGASRLQPVHTRHTVVTRVNTARLLATAIEATEQCERLSVPEIAEPARLDDVLAGWTASRVLIICDETGRGAPIAQVARTLPLDRPHAVLVGPEGGFAPGELDRLRALPFVTPAGLGPRVLRADTAALTALAVVQAVMQERTGAPPPRFASRH
jgi:16S rRNA (uracil1498-N3)-methyltransferase